jgi:hypothetical protein
MPPSEYDDGMEVPEPEFRPVPQRHCPADCSCREQLRAENERLRDENERLRGALTEGAAPSIRLTAELLGARQQWEQRLRSKGLAVRLAETMAFDAGFDAAAALRAAEADTVRLDWLLLDYAPDGIGGYDIWDWVDGETPEVDAAYLKAARRAIDATRGEEAGDHGEQ